MELPDNSLLKCFDAWYTFNTSSKYGNHDTRFADKLVRDAVGFGFMFSQKEIEAQLAAKDKEIEELKAQLLVATKGFREAVLTSKWQAITNKELNKSLEETLRLKAELQAIRSQEPVAYWDGKRYTHLSWSNSDPNCSTPLYAHPVIKEEK